MYIHTHIHQTCIHVYKPVHTGLVLMALWSKALPVTATCTCSYVTWVGGGFRRVLCFLLHSQLVSRNMAEKGTKNQNSKFPYVHTYIH